MERFHGRLQKETVSGRNSVGEIVRKWHTRPHAHSMAQTEYAGKTYNFSTSECKDVDEIVSTDGSSKQALGTSREGIMISYISLVETVRESNDGFFGVSGMFSAPALFVDNQFSVIAAYTLSVVLRFISVLFCSQDASPTMPFLEIWRR